MTFEDLKLGNPLQNAIEDLEYVYPTPIQVAAMPVVTSGKDVVGIAQTGTGKTFAYLLPILKQLKYQEKKQPRVLIMVPTRELVVQVCNEIEKLTKYMSVKTGGVYGGTNINTQKKLVHEGLDIVVATPGRLLDLALTGVLRLKSVQKLVIDEVDEMMNLGFRGQLNDVLDLLPEKRQNILFSATLTPDVEKVVDDFFSFPEVIEIAAHGTPLERIEQFGYVVNNLETKVNLLKYLLKGEEYKKVLVFVGNKRLADKLYVDLEPLFGEELDVIHSNKSQNYRLNVIKAFESGKVRALVATDIIARGIDIQDVSHVINMDIPEEAATYIHRIGRTGRHDKFGVSIAISSPVEEERVEHLESLMKQKINWLEKPEEVEEGKAILNEDQFYAGDKTYVKVNDVLAQSQGAFHEKKAKNQKVNLGSAYYQKKKAERKKKRRR